MPPAFEFPTSTNVEVWTPLAFDPKDMHGRSRRARSLTVVGRIAPTAPPRSRRRKRSACSPAASRNEFKDSNAGWSARVVAAHEQLVGASRPALMVLMGAVGFLLLIVCANMANLLLARLSSRRREMAVRGALGASRWEVARPIIAESLLLSFAGGVLGLLGAVGGLRLLATLPEARLPRMDQIQLDGGVLLFTTRRSRSASRSRSDCCRRCTRREQELRDEHAGIVGNNGEPVRASAAERAGRRRSRARAGAARRRRA